MNLFNRIANLISGFFNSLLGGIEKSNPELVYEQAIDNKINQHNKLRKAVASLTMMRNKTLNSLEEERSKLEEINLYLESSLSENDDESSVMLLEQKNETEDRLLILEKEFSIIDEQTNDAMQSLASHREEIDKLKREKSFKLAQHKAAELKNQAFEQINGISEDADSKAIENIREEIDSEVAKANLNSEMNKNSYSFKMKALKTNSSKLKAQKQLEALKQQKIKIAKNL